MAQQKPGILHLWRHGQGGQASFVERKKKESAGPSLGHVPLVLVPQRQHWGLNDFPFEEENAVGYSP